MKILMLGWEYPPHISGGLGIACEGLTLGLSRRGAEIDFVIPYLSGQEDAPHMDLWDGSKAPPVAEGSVVQRIQRGEHVTTWTIPADLSPYINIGPQTASESQAWQEILLGEMLPGATADADPQAPTGVGRYGRTLFDEVARFTKTALRVASHLNFDLIHAHDWMTFPAAIAISRLTGKPLIVHIHSLEQDRSGDFGNDTIKAVERAGLEAAKGVIAVSFYTRSRIQRFYGISPDKIFVVYNGIYPKEIGTEEFRVERHWAEHVVLFLGRVTFQKGPDYFVEAAAKAIPHLGKVTFVIAGTGDMMPQLKRRIKELKLESYFDFTGFLSGHEVEKVFSVADLYVMPSVSEPFGISALEAISYDTPLLVSKQSGVAEVLSHALKFDFWDTDKLANLIVGALRYPELRMDLIDMARQELKTLHWDAAAGKTLETYQRVLAS